MAAAPSTTSSTADNGDFAIVNGHTVTTSVKNSHNDGSSMTGAQLPVPMEAEAHALQTDTSATVPPQVPQSTSTAADTVRDNVEGDVNMHSQPGSSFEASTIPAETRNGQCGAIWKTQTSPQCSPITRWIPHGAEYISQSHTALHSTTATVNAWKAIANAKTIQHDAFTPTLASEDNKLYSWWMWLSRPQYEQYVRDGTIPGYKETRLGATACKSTTGSTITRTTSLECTINQ
eukprot:3797806-Amphidinium_carterae.2